MFCKVVNRLDHINFLTGSFLLLGWTFFGDDFEFNRVGNLPSIFNINLIGLQKLIILGFIWWFYCKLWAHNWSTIHLPSCLSVRFSLLINICFRKFKLAIIWLLNFLWIWESWFINMIRWLLIALMSLRSLLLL